MAARLPSPCVSSEHERWLTAEHVRFAHRSLRLLRRVEAEEARFAFQRAVSPEPIAEALQSLEMEGFDVSVPTFLRPARLPRMPNLPLTNPQLASGM